MAKTVKVKISSPYILNRAFAHTDRHSVRQLVSIIISGALDYWIHPPQTFLKFFAICIKFKCHHIHIRVTGCETNNVCNIFIETQAT